jgi:hypothetical protein
MGVSRAIPGNGPNFGDLKELKVMTLRRLFSLKFSPFLRSPLKTFCYQAFSRPACLLTTRYSLLIT